jgi:electron transfer flavoprotein alpha/beta subunit
MDVQRKEEILEQALELAFNLKDKGMKVQALTVIIPHLDESKQKEIIDKAVYFKHEVQSKYLRREAAALLRRAETLLSLAPHLEVSSTIF